MRRKFSMKCGANFRSTRCGWASIFQDATGLAPLEYVHTLRIEEAKHPLETGDEPIEAVAELLRYEDAGFFSRLFKKRVNLPPAQYRRRFGSLRCELLRAK